MNRFSNLAKRVLPWLAVGLGLLLALWIVLAPAETRLGNVVKLVYVHGALVWSGLFCFSVAGLLGLVALVARHVVGRARPAAAGPGRATAWDRGTRAAGMAALVVWIVYAISSMIVTELTWGQWIAWNEPRVRATASILLAALILAIVVRLVDDLDLYAIVNLAMGIVPWVVVQRVEAIRHPVNPIGGSGSAAIQDFYLLIVLTVAALALTLVAWLWVGAEEKATKLQLGAGEHVSYQDH